MRVTPARMQHPEKSSPIQIVTACPSPTGCITSLKLCSAATLRAFRKQQEGYGEAEAMLRFKHLVFFGPTGQAKWKGQIYGGPRFNWLLNPPVIYHGVFGQGLFQSLYAPPPSTVAGYLSSIEWVALTGFMAVVSVPLAWLRIVPYLMFLGTVTVALSYIANVRIE